ncbi:MAG: ornithine carbamoyltransferase [Planctomycetota bacterium]|nr:MAG: ornithine carbamoyltransferase [Planctomycetota bacterium]
MTEKKSPRHLISLDDLSAAEIERIFAISADLKAKLAEGVREPLLPNRVLALLFEKPSLRTRVSFEAGMAHLGGSTLFLSDDTGFGKRESMADFSRVLSQYVDGIVMRTKKHETIVEVARYAECSVINGLSDVEHPCQALADLFTVREIAGSLKGHTLAWVGDGNNVARSLALACGKLGMRMVMACPAEYRFDEAFKAQLKQSVPQLELEEYDDPAEAVRDALVVYTDVWVSMGQEAEKEKRLRDFAPYQVNEKLMSHTQKGAVFMHCLPAHRGEEVTDEVIDGPQSVVVQQAANRMHVQKGVLAWLLAAH